MTTTLRRRPGTPNCRAYARPAGVSHNEAHESSSYAHVLSKNALGRSTPNPARYNATSVRLLKITDLVLQSHFVI
ncbi:hypothetical protein [Streptomyces sp. CA-106110]|uniref:hypothetical protein n=1 Tax=Streptomyces sp. CA-106110 TaxID=3240044 RepID=UPI003D8B05F1